jgi:hypothetical protein
MIGQMASIVAESVMSLPRTRGALTMAQAEKWVRASRRLSVQPDWPNAVQPGFCAFVTPTVRGKGKQKQQAARSQLMREKIKTATTNNHTTPSSMSGYACEKQSTCGSQKPPVSRSSGPCCAEECALSVSARNPNGYRSRAVLAYQRSLLPYPAAGASEAVPVVVRGRLQVDEYRAECGADVRGRSEEVHRAVDLARRVLGRVRRMPVVAILCTARAALVSV